MILSYLQKVGQALMVPVAILPAAAILMGIGYWIDPIGWGKHSTLAAFLIKSGSSIIENMPMLFAIGISYGMSKDKSGTSALTGFVGFLVVTTLCSPTSISMIQKIPLEQVPSAFSKIDNQFIGILVGMISAMLYNRFSHVELNKALSFFSGSRLVPILNSFSMILVAFILMYVWPFIFNKLVLFGEYIQYLESVGAGIYAFFNRLLIPVGLHHALNAVFWFDVAGINDIPKFLGGQQSIEGGIGITGITGRYQAGFFPIMMFGLPGAALAIFHCAKPENRNKVAGIMLAASLSSFFTGITEPIEFSFMFIAPVLYFIHALLTGLSVFISSSMHWIAGFGFSAGLVDMILSSRNPLAVKWYMLIPQGLVFFVAYYLTFRFFIKRFNLLTPGRELDIVNKDADNDKLISGVSKENSLEMLAHGYIKAAGGSENLIDIDACITRLRLSVKDSSIVNESNAKNLGAQGVIKLNKESVQIIVGTRASIIADTMRSILKRTQTKKQKVEIIPPSIAKVTSVVSLISPITGEVVPLGQVPDEAFSNFTIGKGIAVRPTDKSVLSPACGHVAKILNTYHAFCLETEIGAEVIVHIGINTMALNGNGFTSLVKEGSKVEQGQPILELDLLYLNTHAYSMISPVVVSNTEKFNVTNFTSDTKVVAGQSRLFEIHKK